MKRLLVILIFTASYAHADIYTWTDNKGTRHYTNNEYEIPERYRAKSKVLDLGIVEKKANSSPQLVAPSLPNAPVPQGEQVQPANPAKPSMFQNPGARSIRRQAVGERPQ